MRLLLALALLAFAHGAAADLYRWVDPETGSVKFSSYPPPWYAEGASPRGKPKVERIPPGRQPVVRVDDAPADAPGDAGARADGGAEALASQRKALMGALPALAAQRGNPRGAQDLQKLVESLAAVSGQLDKLDPAGAGARAAEVKGLLQQLLKGEAR